MLAGNSVSQPHSRGKVAGTDAGGRLKSRQLATSSSIRKPRALEYHTDARPGPQALLPHQMDGRIVQGHCPVARYFKASQAPKTMTFGLKRRHACKETVVTQCEGAPPILRTPEGCVGCGIGGDEQLLPAPPLLLPTPCQPSSTTTLRYYRGNSQGAG